LRPDVAEYPEPESRANTRIVFDTVFCAAIRDAKKIAARSENIIFWYLARIWDIL